MAGYALVFTAAVLWSLIGILSRGLLDAGLQPLEIAFWRAVIAGTLFVAVAAVGRTFQPVARRDLILITIFAAVGIALYYSSLSLAIDTGGISLAFILLYTAPAFVALFAWWLLKEPLTGTKAALVVIAMAGVALVSQDRGAGISVTGASLMWGLVAGLGYASYYIFGRVLFVRYSPTLVLAMVLPVGAFLLAPVVEFAPKDAAAWLLLLPLGVVCTFLGFLLYAWGLRYVEASRAVLVATVEPVSAALLAAIVFGERFGVLGLSGGALILLAAVLAALSGSNSERP